MKNWIVTLVLGATALTAPALAQNSPLPLPPPIEKELAARASNVTEVTLGKSMLAFASKFMNGKDPDDAQTRRLIEGLDGIYVREYEFDKEGQFSSDEIEKLRAHFATSEWSSIVRERDKRSGETTDVMVKLVNGETHGMFILETEPKELTIVLILGPIRMEDLGKLKGLNGLGALGAVGEAIPDSQSHPHGKDTYKNKDKDDDKEKGKEPKGAGQ
jgi:Domain of unknown function (DUF4252)